MDKRWVNVYHKMLQNAENEETQGTQILLMKILFNFSCVSFFRFTE